MFCLLAIVSTAFGSDYSDYLGLKTDSVPNVGTLSTAEIRLLSQYQNTALNIGLINLLINICIFSNSVIYVGGVKIMPGWININVQV